MKRTNARLWLFQKLRPYTKRIVLGLGLAACSGAVATIDPLLMRQLIDVALPRRDVRQTTFAVISIALCFVGRSVFGGLSGLASYRVTQWLGQDLRSELLVHMTNLSADWHEKTMLGEKLSRIDQDVEQISQYGADVGNTIFRSFVFFVVNVAIMMALNWRMTIAVLPLLPLFLWVRLRFREKIQSRADHAQVKVGKATGDLAEHLNAVPQIQILGAEEARIARTVRAWLDQVGAQWKQRRTEIAFSVSVTSVLAVGILLVLGLGAHEYFIGALSVGGLVAFYAYVTRIFEPVSSAMELYSRTQRMLASARRVHEVLDTEPSVADVGTIQNIPAPLVEGVVCEAISFGYRPERPVLRDVSLRLQKAERVALVGSSGSGKSTLSRLFARMADPTTGRILLEGKPLHEYSLRALRKSVCYVPQQPLLFSGTIRENLRYANADATEAEMERVIEAAQLSQLLRRLPLGLETVLGQDAAGISGGEKQRLAVARSLLRRPSVLILDESTSALDLPTEYALFKALASFQDNMAMILISHRLRSLTWVDRLIVLDAGSIVAEGTHAQLVCDCSVYQALYERDQPEASRSMMDKPIGAMSAVTAVQA
ncbi:ABC-type multidrug transport system fused ATPase/permease subunit [Silvibacterium bohemicum]|uniref:ABC-type multidrug transport system fused ATPase/permease subunit n=1 Tax=Silvibacterium bohemicum TaxID=1577686 RepID=A0A841JV35_9BACT|nr:ABC transporter ATP-binding protein [Silvibacterium bohemicum]MBB6144395.1 ABC-type multidrug transport system fused ATPase/permease subunit [Silvibacterium bohemicum]